MPSSKNFKERKTIIAIVIAIITAVFVIGAISVREYVNSEAFQVKKLLAEREESGESDEDIDFKAFFLRDTDGDGYAEIMDEIDRDFETEEAYKNNTGDDLVKETMWVELNIKKPGTLKNAKVTIEDSNFYWKTNMIENNAYKSDYIGYNDVIEFKDLNSGTQILSRGDVESKIENNSNDYNKESAIVLTGTFVDNDGNEIEIRKESKLTLNWYGTPKTQVDNINYGTRNIETAIKEDCFDANFSFLVKQTNPHLLMDKQEVEVEIPSYNGYAPISVTTSSGTIVQEYDEENKTIKIVRESTLDEDGNIVKSIERYGYYAVDVKYPIEAYENSGLDYAIFRLNVKGKSYVFNGKQETEFIESEDSQMVTIIYRKEVIVNHEPRTWEASTTIGSFSSNGGTYSRYISKQKPYNIYKEQIYESDEDDDIYYVSNYIYAGQYQKIKNFTITLSDVDKFNNSISMRDYVTTTGIYFNNATEMLGDNGTIELYNADNNELVETFTKESWEKYTKSNPYITNLKTLKVITSNPVKNVGMYIMQIKTLNDEAIVQDFDEEAFDNLSRIYTSSRYQITLNENQLSNCGTASTNSESAYYILPYSEFDFYVTPTEIPNQKTHTLNMRIFTTNYNAFQRGWINGKFLIELPEEIINANISNITISNSNVKIKSQVLYQAEGKWFLRIDTENNVEESYNIDIDLDVNANPLHGSSVNYIRLYAYNENCNIYQYKGNDLYDLDNDTYTDDYVGNRSNRFEIVAAEGLITEEFISNYDDEGSIAIAPIIAEIDRSDEARLATVNVSIANNFPEKISELVILGKTPYENNKFILTDASLGSQYTANMTGPISVPEELEPYTTIYYSEKEEPTKDLTDTSNGWTQNVQDWSKIKSYLINLGNYELTNTGNKEFSYNVQVPAGLGYNEATYGAHAVYFCINTDYGKYRTEIQPNKVGIRVVSKYNLELTKNKLKYNNILVPGAIYSVTTKVDGVDITKVATTDSNGKLEFKGLYSGNDYTLSEISSPNDYALNDNKVVFNTDVDISDITVKSGSFREQPTITTNDSGTCVLKANVEDEAKYKLIINVQDEAGNLLTEEKFTIIGNGKENIVKTVNGVVEISDLYLGSEYQLTEIKSDGYYIDEEARVFKVVRNETTNELEIETEDNDLDAAVITEEVAGQNIVNVTIVNKKIPTYNLQVFKIEEPSGEEELKYLAGAEFRVEKEDLNETEVLTTNEEGAISLDNLYAYVQGKKGLISGKYTIQEIKAPDNYSNNMEKIEFFVEENSGVFTLNIENINSLDTIYNTEIENNTVKIYIQDKPLFKLVKKDSETGEVLKNAEFVIYELDSNDKELDFAKDVNGNYVGKLNESGDYIVTTDENGVIILPLRAGRYVIKEVGYPEGYLEESNYQVFKVRGTEEEEEVEEEEQREFKNTIEINYIEDLVDLSNAVNSGVSYKYTEIKLAKDLDFRNEEHYKNPDNEDYGDINEDGNPENIYNELTNYESESAGFKPIGVGNYSSSNNCYFDGVFDGQGYEIKNLWIQRGNYAGLFGRVKNAEIKNLTLSGEYGACIGNNAMFVGGFTAISDYSSLINCHNNILVELNSSFTNMQAIEIGGIVGYLPSGYVINCSNSAKIEINNSTNIGVGSIGGIAGSAAGSSIIKNSFNIGTIKNIGLKYGDTGGIAGRATIIENCFNRGNLYSSFNNNDSIYSAGISAEVRDIKNCYNTGNIVVENAVDTTSAKIGGIRAVGSGTLNNCYYLDSATISSGTISTNGTPMSAEDMKTDEFVTTLGEENFSKDIDLSNDGYPIIKVAQEENSGAGIDLSELENKEYTQTLEINTIEDLVDFSTAVNEGNTFSDTEVKLMRTLDLAEAEFKPIGVDSPFKGKFDGQGFEIKNIYINNQGDYSYCGLFGEIQEGIVLNLGITGKIVNSYYAYVGAISGEIEQSIVKNCYSSCEIESSDESSYVGGLIGYAYSSDISDCYNTGSLPGERYTGGIVGNGYIINIYNCHNTGKINENESQSNDNYMGGIIGYLNYSGIIDNCYNEAEIKSDNSSTVGGIAGYIDLGENSLYKNIIIKNSYNTGTIKGTIIGGIVGDSYDNSENYYFKIEKCYNTGDIIRNSCNSNNYNGTYEGVGGIIGRDLIYNSKISNCYNTGDITSDTSTSSEFTENSAGGIVGYCRGVVTDCYNQGEIKLYFSYMGGIIGYLETTPEKTYSNCYNTGNIISDEVENSNNSGYDFYVGGLIGYLKYANESNKTYNLSEESNVLGCTINNCYNLGNVSSNINIDYSDISRYIAGLVGGFDNSNSYKIYNSEDSSSKTMQFKTKVNYCYNNGKVKASNGTIVYAGGITAYAINTDFDHCYNTGSVEGECINYCNANEGDVIPCVGGIVGYYSNGAISCCYNAGLISSKNTYDSNSCDSSAGGIVGYGNGVNICDTYNTGKIICQIASTNKAYCGGIAGKIDLLNNTYGSAQSYISNSYNVGELTNDGLQPATAGQLLTLGGITGYTNKKDNIINSYYIKDDRYNSYGTPKSDVQMISKDFYDTLNVDGVWKYNKNNFPTLADMDIFVVGEVKEVAELDVENTIKKFKITTKVENSNGGSITAEDEEYSEIVYYGKSNTRAIEMNPDDGYSITKITINGIEQAIDVDKNEEYTFPIGYFDNMDEDKDIIVSYTADDTILTINKVDENDPNKKLEGASFAVTTDPRDEITNELGDIVSNENDNIADFNKVDGKYISNIKNQNDKVARAYVPIDLTECTGEYNLTINAEISSQEDCDYGFATVRNDLDSPDYYDDNGRVVYISGEQAAQDYTYSLYGGSMYYLHLGYYKDYSTSSGGDTFTINSIELSLNRDGYYYEEYTTNKFGQIKATVPGGAELIIRELVAPEGYRLSKETTSYTMDPGETNEITITNKEKIKLTVHHYIKGSPEESPYKIAEDVVFKGDVGESYEITPRADIGKFKLAKDNEGKYIIPENAKGVYGETDIEVVYYYEAEPIKLTIHHYYEGTEDKYANDEIIESHAEYVLGADDIYTVSTDTKYEYTLNNSDVYSNLPEEIELSSIRSTLKEEISIDDTVEYYEDTEVNFYYKAKQFDYVIHYFYDGVEDESNKETGTEDFGRTITYKNKIKDGYKLDRVEGSPLVISSDVQANVINVYYEQPNTLKIIKTDEDGNKLQGAKFEVTSVDSSMDVINEINYADTIETEDVSDDINKCMYDSSFYDYYSGGFNNSYSFYDNGEQYISYAYEYSKDNSICMGYMSVDLENKTGKYKFTANAEISSEENGDYGYIIVNEVTSSDSSNIDIKNLPETAWKIANISGEVEAKDYVAELQGGNYYYIYFVYAKDDSGDEGEDKFTINNVKLEQIKTYEFEEENGVYTSTNANVNGSKSYSYIPLDLTNYIGDYKVTIDTEIEANDEDKGIVAITESAEIPTNIGDNLIAINGEATKEESKVLTGGKKYYIHMIYENGQDDAYNADTFKINSINVELDKATLTSDENGNAIMMLNAVGSFKIKEIEAPKNYELDDTEYTIDVLPTDKRVEKTILNNKMELKSFKIRNEWIASKSSDYRTTFTLYKTVDGVTSKALDNNPDITIEVITEDENGVDKEVLDGTTGEISAVVDGNGIITFNNLPKYENDKEITYSIVEEEFDKTEDDGNTWEVVPSSEVKVKHEGADENYDDVIKCSIASRFGIEINQIASIENTPLKDVEYNISIKDQEENELVDQNQTYKTDENGNLEILDLVIADSNKKYTVTISTKVVPKEYAHVGPITFDVNARENEYGTYELTPDSKDLDSNSVEITEEKISVNLVTGYKNDLTYTVFYLDKTSKDELSEAKVGRGVTFNEVIEDEDELIDIPGYTYSNSLQGSITISEDNSKNMLTLYYVPDYSQTKELKYTVEYYKDDVKVDADSYEVKETVWINAENTLTVQEISKPNDKYEGYKLDGTDPATIPATIATNSVIKVNYVKDETQTKELKYTVEYYKDNEKVEEDSYEVKETVWINAENTLTVQPIDTANNKYVGYEFNSTDPTTIPATIAANSVIKVNYVKDETQTKELKYTVEYYKDNEKVENDSYEVKETVWINAENTLTVQAIDTANNKYVGYKFDSTDPATIPATIATGSTIKVNYVIDQIQIKTEVITHTENYTNGLTASVKGGSITGEENEYIELVVRGNDATSTISVEPDEGYRISRITVNENELDLDSYLTQDGKVNLSAENCNYLRGITSDVEVKAEFAKESKVIVKYMDVENKTEIETQVIKTGLEGETFTTERKVIENYRTAEVELTQNGVATGETASETYEGFTIDGDLSKYTGENNVMYSNTITIIYWYERIPEATVVVKRIEVTDADINAGLTLKSGEEIESESYTLQPGQSITVYRKAILDEETNRNYIAESGPTVLTPYSVSETVDGVDIVVLEENENEYTATMVEKDSNNDGKMDSMEIRYYYARQYKVSASVEGGQSEGAEDEIVTRLGTNTNEIVANALNEDYEIKSIKINGKEAKLNTLVDENGTVRISAGYFTNIQEDKNILITFGKISTKLIIKYLEENTNKQLDAITTIGTIGDSYKAESKEIEGYELVSSKLPTNAEGTMTKEDIEVIYYYKKVESENNKDSDDDTSKDQNEDPNNNKEGNDNKDISNNNQEQTTKPDKDTEKVPNSKPGEELSDDPDKLLKLTDNTNSEAIVQNVGTTSTGLTNTNNPKTSDNISETIKIFAIAFIAFIFKKKKRRKNRGKHAM